MSKLPIHVLPRRKYCDGEKKMVSMRLPIKLMQELEKLSKENGMSVTDLAQTALDEFIQWTKGK